MAKPRDHDRGDHFFGRRLAVAAGDGNHRDRELMTPSLTQREQRCARVTQCNLRQCKGRVTLVDDRHTSAQFCDLF